MGVIAYILIGIAIAIGGWWAIKVAIGLGLPIENTAFAYFTQRLKAAEILDVVPTSCVAECVAESIKFARSSARLHGNNQSDVRTESVKQLDLHADMLRLWVHSADPFGAPYQRHFRELFERHLVPRQAVPASASGAPRLARPGATGQTPTAIDKLLNEYLSLHPAYEYPASGDTHPAVLALGDVVREWLIKRLGGPTPYWRAMLESASVWFPPGTRSRELRIFCNSFEASMNVAGFGNPDCEGLSRSYNEWRRHVIGLPVR